MVDDAMRARLSGRDESGSTEKFSEAVERNVYGSSRQPRLIDAEIEEIQYSRREVSHQP